MIYAKLAFYAVLVTAIAYGGYHVADLKGKAALEKLQLAWDADKAAIQKAADAAIAQATKDRDAALEANGVIQSEYQTQLSSANASAAQFANRLRNAESRLTASSSSTGKANSGQTTTATGTPTSADQLGQLVSLVTDLRTECLQNADQLDSLTAEIRPQL
jgi:hypothetical protein